MHNQLLKKRDELEARWKEQDAELAGQINRLAADEDYKRHMRALTIAKQFDDLNQKRRARELAHKAEIEKTNGELASVADDQIMQALRLMDQEKRRTQNEMVTRASIERNPLGGGVGHLITNAPRLTARLSALNQARTQLEALRLQPQEDIAAKIAEIQASIPILDATTETIECRPSIAEALQ